MMKKLLFILALCLSVFASAQCPPLNLVQNAKWKFTFSQCFQDTAVYSYVVPSRVAYFDANGNLTYITYAQLADSVGVSSPSGNQWNIQYNDGGNFGSSTNFNYNGFNGIFYIYDVNGDTLFSVNVSTREIRSFGSFALPELADSALTFIDANKHLVNDSNNLAWDGNTLYLLNKNNATTSTGAIVITSNVQSLGRVVQSISSNTSTAAPQYQYFRSRGTLAAPTVPILGTYLGEINFGGYNGTSFSGSSTSIRAIAGGTWTSAASPTYFSFTTSDNNSSTFSTFLTKKGTWSILGTENDTAYTLDVHGTAAVVITPSSTNGNDTLIVKDGTTRQLLGATLTSMLDTINAPTVTGSSAFSAFRINQTWNTTGSPTGIFANFTNTASGASAKLIDLQRSGVSQWAVNKNGTMIGNTNGGQPDFTSALGSGAFRTKGVGRENNSLTFEIQAGRAHSTQSGVEILGGSSTFTGTGSTLYGVNIASPTFVPSGAGSANFRTIGINYTINAAAGAQTGIATGLFLNATETSLNGLTHNLVDLQVGGSNKFLITNTGATTIGSVLTLTPMTSTAASALTPVFGMLVVVSDTNGTFTSTGLWFYDSAAWVKLN